MLKSVLFWRAKVIGRALVPFCLLRNRSETLPGEREWRGQVAATFGVSKLTVGMTMFTASVCWLLLQADPSQSCIGTPLSHEQKALFWFMAASAVYIVPGFWALREVAQD